MISNLAVKADGFTSNAFIVKGERPVLVDAGQNFDVVTSVRKYVGSIDTVVLTHTHEDHVGNLPDLREAFDVEVLGFDPEHEAVDRALADGDTVEMGDHEYRVLHTPGHAPDHLCLYAEDAGILFTGDLVFTDGNFGRTDLPGGDLQALRSSIQRLVEVVDEDALEELHVGHGSSIVGKVYPHIEAADRTSQQVQ